MRKWFVALLAVSIAGIAQAQGPGAGSGGPGGPGAGAEKGGNPRMRPASITKEQFVERQKRMAERQGKEFDQAAAEARFAELDKNADGVLTGAELPRRPMEPVTKEQFVERQKRMAERRGEEFDPAVAEAKFAELDKNKDGVLTSDEMRQGRRNRPEGPGKGASDPEKGTGDDSGDESAE